MTEPSDTTSPPAGAASPGASPPDGPAEAPAAPDGPAAGDPAPEATADDELAREEPELGSTPASAAVNKALRAMARAARSFLLYDPHNEAIRHFLADYKATMEQALAHGPVELDIRPFDMLYRGEIVYVERDWERSLAFRCYRDGVRRLVIAPSATWDELLRLLGILSIRFTGVRQQEDDIVTLLWKAGFQHIETIAVEGFVPDEEGEEGEEDAGPTPEEAAAIRRTASHVEVPSDWDLPCEPHPELAAVQYRPLAEDELEPLRAELSSVALPGLTVRLLREMLALARDPTDPTTVDDIQYYVSEIRGFLLSEGQLAMLLEVVRELSANRDLGAATIDGLLAQFTDAGAIRRILHSVPSSARQVPPELVELLELVPGDHLAILVEVLGVERSQASRRIARQLIERYVSSRMEYIEERIAAADPQVAADLLRAVASASLDLGIRLAARVVDNPETDVQLQVERVLAQASAEQVGRERLEAMLVAPFADVRKRVIGMLVELGDPASFNALLEHLERPAAGRLERDEIVAIGRALARLHPARAWATFHEVVQPSGFLERVLAGGPTQKPHRQWAAVAALGVLPGEKPEKAIRWLAKRAGEELHQHCMRTLVLRRREGIE